MYCKVLFILTLLCFGLTLHAQELTYVEDYKVVKVFRDLVGYDVHPGEVQLANERYPSNVPDGWVHFKFRADHVEILEKIDFKPGGVKKKPLEVKAKKWNIQTDWGNAKKSSRIILSLYDPGNRKHEAQVILHLNYTSNIDRIEFRPDMHKSTPRVYHLAKTPDAKKMDYSLYFTHEPDYEILKMDPFIGNKLYPFIEIVNSGKSEEKRITRIYEEDRVSIEFKEKTITVGKKEKQERYITFQTKEGEHSVKTETFRIKKAKLLSQKKKKKGPGVPSKVMRLSVEKFGTTDPYIVYLKRGVGYKLRSVELVEEKNNKIHYFFKFRDAARTKPVDKN